MKDRIKFSDEMLAAVMDGRKTQTRRLMKPQPVLNGNFYEVFGAGWSKGIERVIVAPGHSLERNFPYGLVDKKIQFADKDGNIKGEIEIVDVWLQRVQEISQEDAKAEGFELTGWIPTYSDPDSGGEQFTPCDNFAEAWIDIYGADGWNNNPWVWVIEFKQIQEG
ncbi:ASCH domain-containing protein [Morganella morganii subsp. morganii]|uniref:ASCH domain-containing protein n=1 Tax=Morganella morganii TaxID=582 RepID=UPI001BDA0784|nr:ASCH domain-containing protein [Morganella morganii]MBT0387746.1 ASCH domain-containing protein [Morganella morganii subsp. morganii]